MSLPARHYCALVAASAVLLLCADAVRAATQDDARRAPTAAVLRTEYTVLSTRFARSVPDWRPETPATGSLLFIAPDQYTPAGGQGERHRNARNKYADALFELARRAADAGQSSLAFQWATEAVRENPDHADARRVLGYEENGGQWLTRYGVRMADAGKTWHAKFGWISPADAARYEAGERLVGRRWISAADDIARHADIKNGWQIRTDHFMVTSNHSLEAATELAARLERLHQIWRQLFAGFYLSEREVRDLFAGKRDARRQVRPFRVYYHRDRDQYRAVLRRRQPRIAETLGIYFDMNQEAHFFAGAEQDARTLYHEAVHQLFQESKPAAPNIGGDANFWIVEGVATYFETLTEHANSDAGLYYTTGEASAGRMQAARERLQDGFYVPLADLTRFGKNDMQSHPDIARLYSQSAGLTAFLMNGEGGRYRESLVRYLEAVYTGRDNDQTLAEVTGGGYLELDRQYRRYMESLP